MIAMLITSLTYPHSNCFFIRSLPTFIRSLSSSLVSSETFWSIFTIEAEVTVVSRIWCNVMASRVRVPGGGGGFVTSYHPPYIVVKVPQLNTGAMGGQSKTSMTMNWIWNWLTCLKVAQYPPADRPLHLNYGRKLNVSDKGRPYHVDRPHRTRNIYPVRPNGCQILSWILSCSSIDL